MPSNNTRRIFVNVLVNGNIYQKRVALDININDNPDEEAKTMLNGIALEEGIPLKLLSYKIVNEHTREQSLVLEFLDKALYFAKTKDIVNFGGGLMMEDGSPGSAYELSMYIEGIGHVSIRAKDINIKE